jgi:uncharacterized protein GlcG (DUF336 family)
MDGTSFMTPEIAIAKAWTAAAAKIPTGVLGGALAGETAFLTGAGIATNGRFIASAGGVPVTVDGQVVGGVGASGGSIEQDGAVAEAAAA